MDTFLSKILPALIALAGTLGVAYIGYRQWKKDRSATHTDDYLKARREAYKAAWEKLEAAHLYVRSEKFERATFNELMRDVNSHLMKVGLYLESGEKSRVNEYLNALRGLGEVLAGPAADRMRDEVRESMYTTGAIPIGIRREAPKLAGAYDDVERRRDVVKDQFRRVLTAGDI
jgi:hypothetical protein